MFDPQMVPIRQDQGEQHQEIIHRLILYMEEHYREKITLEDLAAYFQYNRTYISTLDVYKRQRHRHVLPGGSRRQELYPDHRCDHQQLKQHQLKLLRPDGPG